MKRFNVIVPIEDGGVEVHPMKQWLRQHPAEVPRGLDATSSTSHQLRSGLKKLGWRVQESANEVRLLAPGTDVGAGAIIEVIGPGETPDANEDQDPSEASFALEYQLRDFLAENLAAVQLEGHTLRLYVDPSGRDGIEYPTAVGPIDILAVDETGALVVFELKRARSPDHALGQLARYMGWVKQTIGKGNDVRGVIVAKEIGDKLRYGASIMPNVSLQEYEVEFRLRPANAVPENE